MLYKGVCFFLSDLLIKFFWLFFDSFLWDMVILSILFAFFLNWKFGGVNVGFYYFFYISIVCKKIRRFRERFVGVFGFMKGLLFNLFKF